MAVESAPGQDDAAIAARPATAAGRSTIVVTVDDDIARVEGIWRTLTAASSDVPAQSYDFIRLWIQSCRIPRSAQAFVVGWIDGEPVALLPLHRRTTRGVRVFTWFPGSHLGCYLPVVDAPHLKRLGEDDRRRLWSRMLAALPGADLVYLRAVPEGLPGYDGLFHALGTVVVPGEGLYRASFGSWAEADRLQRSRSRRKHDRQQGERLAALGEVGFALLDKSECPGDVIDTMFVQRARRFDQQGIADPFRKPGVRAFYDALMRPDSGVDVKVHVLRLNGEIVAVRFNVATAGRLYCLISSMSDDPVVQAGSPGKQCLLRVMQTVFDDGYSGFDMGAGLTDEKRHWCNQRIQLNGHNQPLTRLGQLVLYIHVAYLRVRRRIKTNPMLLGLARSYRQLLLGFSGRRRFPRLGSDQL